ncbi:MAG: hypothetical protein EBT30_00345 [Verrucomicrobia bacterium]|nr:hypothetical protein [Verrucomicrobiota bacterium]
MKPPTPFWIRVPATTANLGPGFDAFGLALNLYNYISVEPGHPAVPDPFFADVVDAYHKARKIPKKPYRVLVRGNVPRSRGLGSSATVRLGILASLDMVYRRKPDLAWLIKTAAALEGHPDNITAAAMGGFVVCAGMNPARTRISPRLTFVAAIPKLELATRTARSVLPSKVFLHLRPASPTLSRRFAPGSGGDDPKRGESGRHRSLPQRCRAHHHGDLHETRGLDRCCHGESPAEGGPSIH